MSDAAWWYFAYGSNMNPARVRQRGLRVQQTEPAMLRGVRLAFDKQSADHTGAGHACLRFDRAATVEGVLYRLVSATDLERMDRFERTPINYSRELVQVTTAAGQVSAWTYFANPAVLRPGSLPVRSYLDHLLAGRAYLSSSYVDSLAAWPCIEDR
jgi:cation transport regulator ChaC